MQELAVFTIQRSNGAYKTFRVVEHDGTGRAPRGSKTIEVLWKWQQDGRGRKAKWFCLGFWNSHSNIVLFPQNRNKANFKHMGIVKRFDAYDEQATEFVDGEEYYLLPCVHCSKCGELLVNPESIVAGIGPVCAGRQWQEITAAERKEFA